MRRITLTIAVCGLLGALLASGCRRGPYLWVQQKRYSPRLPAYLKTAYRGRAIHLKHFVNQTSSTWYYYSPDQGITFEAAPSLEGYTRDCFQKALSQFMGMQVYKKQPPPGVPSLEVTLTSWTSNRVDAQVKLFRGNEVVLTRQVSAVNPPPASTQKPHLEASAFYQMNVLVSRIFMDRAFFNAYYRRAGGAATLRGQPGQGPGPGGQGAGDEGAPGSGPGSPQPGGPGSGGEESPGSVPPPAPGEGPTPEGSDREPPPGAPPPTTF